MASYKMALLEVLSNSDAPMIGKIIRIGSIMPFKTDTLATDSVKFQPIWYPIIFV